MQTTIFSTMLAANIGAGSTVGATALGYRDGLAGIWWVGSAALGSIALALWIGPAITEQASAWLLFVALLTCLVVLALLARRERTRYFRPVPVPAGTD